MKIQDMPEHLRPREKAWIQGIESLSDRELLALFIRSGTAHRSALDLADEVLHKIQGLTALMETRLIDIISIKGIKKAKALELLAVVEMARRMMIPQKHDIISVQEPQHIMNWLNIEIGYAMQEKFMVIFLNTQNHILKHDVLFKGTVNRSVVHPRDVFREAVLLNATRLILVHNHPGKTMFASEADLDVTEAMVRAGEVVGIEVLDHLIVSHGSFFSIRKNHAYLFEE